MPGVVRGSPQVKARRRRVQVVRAQAVDEPHTGPLPDPSGKVSAPLLVAVRVGAVDRPGMPVGAETVAVGIGRIGPVAELARGDRYDPGALRGQLRPGVTTEQDRRGHDQDDRDQCQSEAPPPDRSSASPAPGGFGDAIAPSPGRAPRRGQIGPGARGRWPGQVGGGRHASSLARRTSPGVSPLWRAPGSVPRRERHLRSEDLPAWPAFTLESGS